MADRLYRGDRVRLDGAEAVVAESAPGSVEVNGLHEWLAGTIVRFAPQEEGYGGMYSVQSLRQSGRLAIYDPKTGNWR